MRIDVDGRAGVSQKDAKFVRAPARPGHHTNKAVSARRVCYCGAWIQSTLKHTHTQVSHLHLRVSRFLMDAFASLAAAPSHRLCGPFVFVIFRNGNTHLLGADAHRHKESQCARADFIFPSIRARSAWKSTAHSHSKGDRANDPLGFPGWRLPD